MPRVVKRKRAGNNGRPSKKRRTTKQSSKRRVQRGGTPRKLVRLPFFRTLQPRIYTTHKNKISMQISATSPGFTNANAIALRIGLLRDPDAYVQRKQPFPDNFVTMAGLYRNYRVNAVEVRCTVTGMTNNDNDKFYLCWYTSPDVQGTVDPYPATALGDRALRDSFLQEPHIRKKLISSTGTTGNRYDSMMKVGQFNIPMAERQRRGDLDDKDYAGSVTPAGVAVVDPAKSPNLWIRIISDQYGGFPDAPTYGLAISLKYHVEWFNIRKSLEVTQGETDP